MKRDKETYHFTIPIDPNKKRDLIEIIYKNNLKTVFGFTPGPNGKILLEVVVLFPDEKDKTQEIKQALREIAGPISGQFIGKSWLDENNVKGCIENAGFTILGSTPDPENKFSIYFQIEDGRDRFEKALSIAIDCIIDTLKD